MSVGILETDAPTGLTFTDAKLQGRFELGVSLAIHSWQTLSTAVDNNWGGGDSADKRDWLAGRVVDLFEDKYLEVGDVEDALLFCMQDDFDTDVQDGSAGPIADLVFKIYSEVAEQNFKSIDGLYVKFQEAEEKKKNGLVPSAKVQVEGEDEDEDEEDSSDEDAARQDGDVSMSEDTEYQKQGPIIDDDGFELVQRKKR